MPVVSAESRQPDVVSGNAARRRRRVRKWRWLLRAFSGVATLERCRDQLVVPATSARPESPRYAPIRYTVPCAVHAHTRYSDGAGDPAEVIAAARRAGCRVLVLSDHDTLAPLRDGWEGYHDDVLVLVGAELRTDRGWLLALGVPVDFEAPHSAETCLEAIRLAGGFAFTALPNHPGMAWDDFTHPALSGIEVMNLHCLARQAASLADLPAFLARIATGRRLAALDRLTPRPGVEIGLWERALRAGRSAGIASADAHGQVMVAGRPVPLPTYAESFRLVQTRLVLRQPLSGEFERDRTAVLNALRDGASRLVYPRRGDAGRLRVWFESDRDQATEGEVAEWRPGRIYATSPFDDVLFRLYRDGDPVGERLGATVSFDCRSPGVYRLEAYRTRFHAMGVALDVRPWVLCNPIYLRRPIPMQVEGDGVSPWEPMNAANESGQ